MHEQKKYIIVLLFIFLNNHLIQSKEPDIFLCIDSMLALKNQHSNDQTKLVYGYINGQKTSCMSEYELRSLFSKQLFKDQTSSIATLQKKTFQQNAIYRGEKQLANADLRGLDLQGIDLSGADLTNAQLESADLRNANFKNAKLCGANLKDTYCKNTDFSGADFSNSQLQGTFFLNTTLLNTSGLTVDLLSRVASLFKAKIDDHLTEILEKSYPSKFNPPQGEWIPKQFDSTDNR